MKRESEIMRELANRRAHRRRPQLTALDFAYGRYPDTFDEYAAVTPFVSCSFFALENPRRSA